MAFLCVLFHETSETIGTLETLFQPKNGLKSTKKGDIRFIFESKYAKKKVFLAKKQLFLAHFSSKNR